MQSTSSPLRVLMHAPTPGAVARARNNAVNLMAAAPDAEIRIIVNAEGVAAALDAPHPATDNFTMICATTLKRTGRAVRSPLQTVPVSVLAIALMLQEGWSYIRA